MRWGMGGWLGPWAVWAVGRQRALKSSWAMIENDIAINRRSGVIALSNCCNDTLFIYLFRKLEAELLVLSKVEHSIKFYKVFNEVTISGASFPILQPQGISSIHKPLPPCKREHLEKDFPWMVWSSLCLSFQFIPRKSLYPHLRRERRTCCMIS